MRTQRKIIGILGLSLFPTQALIGIVLGYFLGKFLAGERAGEQGKIKSLIISFKNWKIHLHHWFLGSILLLSSLFNLLSLPQFVLGILGGAIVQGLNYSDWYRILIREKTNENFGN
jgi:hypothetical protein